MNKISNKQIWTISLLFTVICFLFLTCSFRIEMMGELIDNRGYGFPLIWYSKSLAKSILYDIDIKALLIDFSVYYVLVTGILFLLSRNTKIGYLLNNKSILWITISISILVLIIHIPLFFFTELTSLDDYHPIYKTLKIAPLLFR